MTRDEKLKIAREVHKEISLVIDKWEESRIGPNGGVWVSAHWNGCISVDDELFHGHELSKG